MARNIKMQQKHVSSGSLPTLSGKYPWLVAQNLEAEVYDTKDQILYNMHDPLSLYRCRIPELLGRCIRGCYHGWVILSNHPHNVMWSLWNPVTFKTIRLPPLHLKDGDFESIKQCCLSSPPNDPTSVLMLAITERPTIVFCQLDDKRKRLRWKEMSYTKQLRSIAGDSGFLHCLTCCNGKVYALISGSRIVIQVDIKVKDNEVVISLLPFGELPYAFSSGCNFMKPFLKGDCTQLFHIKLGFHEVKKKRLGVVYLFKLDWNSMIWKETEDLKDSIFFINDGSVFYRHEIASDVGGYIHILGDMGKVIYSYDVKDRTISLSSLPCLVQATHVSLWECRLQGDPVEIKSGTGFKQEDVKDDEIIMERKHISSGLVCDQLPTLSVKHPWLVAQNLEAEKDDAKDQTFYNMHDPLSRYRCRIPELFGRCIRGCFHGWVILSKHPHNVMWSLWNPVTSRSIRLPPLILKDGDFESIKQCCLSSPPNDPTSVLMLTRTKTPTIVFCQLDRKRKRLRWKEMTYAKQLKSITGDNGLLHCLTCCNGKVFALSSGGRSDPIVIQVDIVVKDKEVLISLLEFGKPPFPFNNDCSAMKPFLRGYCKDLFFIKLGFDDMAKKTLGAVYLFKLDATNMIWEEMEDLKDVIFFLDLAHDCSVFYRDAIASELGGYIHILGEMGKIIYSYDVKDKTISLSSTSCLEQSTHLSLWECWLRGDQEETECGTGLKPADLIIERPVRDDKVDINNTRNDETHIFNVPLDVLKMIIEFCGCVEYLNFRATCKHFQLAAPMIRWSDEISLRRWQTYSLNSPWLLVFDKHRGIITFTDPMFGDKYYIKMPQKLIGDLRIYCSRFGWLLLYKPDGPGEMFFFNPFTKDIRELPNAPYLDSLFFLAPPASPNCIVAGLSASLPMNFFIYSSTWESSSWARYRMDFGDTTPHSFRFPTLYATLTFALNQGALNLVLANEERDAFWNAVVAEAPRGSSAQYYLANCNEHLLLVVMDELGEFVEVFNLKLSTQEWEKMDSLGRHMIYISCTTCFCMEAKTPEMENKIYFPRLDSNYGKIVFYSLETRRYHTFNGRNIQQCFKDFIGTKYHLYPHAWIQPSWS